MKTRYLMTWTPTRAVIDECRKRGMTDDDGTGYWDWVEPCTCELTEVYPSWTAAMIVAKGKRLADLWKSPRVYEQVYENRDWWSVRLWEVYPGVTKANAIAVD